MVFISALLPLRGCFAHAGWHSRFEPHFKIHTIPFAKPASFLGSIAASRLFCSF